MNGGFPYLCWSTVGIRYCIIIYMHVHTIFRPWHPNPFKPSWFKSISLRRGSQWSFIILNMPVLVLLLKYWWWLIRFHHRIGLREILHVNPAYILYKWWQTHDGAHWIRVLQTVTWFRHLPGQKENRALTGLPTWSVGWMWQTQCYQHQQGD